MARPPLCKGRYGAAEQRRDWEGGAEHREPGLGAVAILVHIPWLPSVQMIKPKLLVVVSKP